MPSQRPFFLSTVFAAFRQQSPTTTALATTTSQQPNKQGGSTSAYATAASATAAAAAAAARSMAAAQSSSSSSSSVPSSAAAIPSSSSSSAAGGPQNPRAVPGGNPLQSPRNAVPIPVPSGGGRRGSDSSTEGFRDVRGMDKWYVGGRTATGEERFFKLGVVRRVRSGDRLSLDKLSL